MIRMRKLIIAFSFIIIMGLFIYASEKFAGTSSMDAYDATDLTGFVSKSSGLDFLPPLNKKKKQIMILAYWRSGSTFVSEIINHYPGTFYHYEPLQPVVGPTLVNKTMEHIAVKLLSDLFNCSYTRENLKWINLDKYRFFFQYNTRLRTSCHISPKLCFDAKFISAMCNQFPFQVIKVTRLTLEPTMQLLDQYPELKIIFLIRDPRGIMSSRMKLDWCRASRSCIDPEILCSSMRQSIASLKVMNIKYPNRILLVRYEDVALYPEEKVKQIFKFLHLDVHEYVFEYLKSHTHLQHNETVSGPYTTKRDSKANAFAWKSKLNFSDVVAIQSKCSDIITGLGHHLINNENELLIQK
uniref:Sulfotransferase domain-containing protein n=1 Tax=Strigamia maritima TaxID=126957 RepID=T1J639_STRMM